MCSSPPEGGRGCPWGRKKVSRPPHTRPEAVVELSNVERVTLRLLADAIVPRTGNTWEPLGGSASDPGGGDLAARAVQEEQPPGHPPPFPQPPNGVDTPATNPP